MSIFLKRNDIKVKNPTTGEYEGQSLFTDGSTTEQIQEITQAGTAQVAAINNKGQETLASIPDDYTELSDSVSNLKSDLTNGYILYPVVTNGSSAASGVTTGNAKRIRTALIPFSAGERLIVDGGSFQHACGMWEGNVSAENVTRNDDVFSSIVETIEPTYEGYIVVVFKLPTNADITPADFDGNVKLYKAITKNIKTLTDSLFVSEDNSTWIQGGFAGSAKPNFTTAGNRCRTPLTKVNAGDKVTITVNGQQFGVSQWTLTGGTWSQIRNDGTFTTIDTVIEIRQDSYIVIAVRKSDNTDLLPSDVALAVAFSGFQSMTDVNGRISASETIQKQIINGFEPLTECGHTVSHRGMPYPENTYYAFEKCIEEGSKVLEMDLAFTSDNVAVLLHDKTINRTARNADGTIITDTISIANITYAQALEYDFGIYMGSQYAGLKIPRLVDVILLLRWKRCAAIIDLLGHEYTTTQYQILHDILTGTGMVTKCALNAQVSQLNAYGEMFTDTPFNPTSSTSNVETMKNLYNKYKDMTPLFVASGYVENASDLSYTFFSEANKRGIVTISGIVNTVQGIKDLFNAGCSMVYSDTIRDSDLE